VTSEEAARLAGIVSAVLGIPETEAASASAEEVSNWDSIAHLNLMMAVEQEFGVRFAAEDIAELDSVPRIREALERDSQPRVLR
jgi:acyl carrier protein